jgi:pimeloyl-ACP methyl ester carboxylesterase
MTASQAALLPELADTDLIHTLPRLDVPLIMVQGRLDQVAPGTAAQGFFDAVSAPVKRLEWFDDSAHTPQFDEPTRLRQLLLDLRTTHNQHRNR